MRAISIWNEPNWHGLLTPERICGKVAKAVKVKGKKGEKGKAHGKKASVAAKKKAKGKAKTRKANVCVKTSARVYRALYVAGYAAVKAAAPRCRSGWVRPTRT